MKHKYILIALGALLTGCAQEKLNLDEKEERSREMQQARAFAAAKNWQAAEQAYNMILIENGSFARPHLDLALIYHIQTQVIPCLKSLRNFAETAIDGMRFIS